MPQQQNIEQIIARNEWANDIVGKLLNENGFAKKVNIPSCDDIRQSVTNSSNETYPHTQYLDFVIPVKDNNMQEAMGNMSAAYILLDRHDITSFGTNYNDSGNIHLYIDIASNHEAIEALEQKHKASANNNIEGSHAVSVCQMPKQRKLELT